MSDSREKVLSQVGYLADELEAQRSVLELIPVPLRKADTPTSPSIARLYGLLLARELDVHAPVCRYLAGGTEEPPRTPVEEEMLRVANPEAELEDLIGEIQLHRQSLVETLQSVVDTAWDRPRALNGRDVTLKDYAYHITQTDVEILRRITELLYEGQMGAPKVRSL